MGLRIKKVKNRAKMTQMYFRDSYWSIKKVIQILKRNKNKKKFIEIKKVKIKTSTHKNNLFIKNYEKWNNLCKCDICGLEGKYFALEKSDNNQTNIFHYNLYTIDTKTNIEIFFNIDHIKPRSKGGRDDMENLQLTCENCNSEKGDYFETETEIIIKKNSFFNQIKLFIFKIFK